MKRLLLTVAAIVAIGGVMATAIVGGTSPDFKTRWLTATTDLTATQASIPHAQLHAKGIEILRVRTLAADEVNDDDEARAAAQSCVAFKATPMEYTTCK
jgi:hypothetical protein